MNILATSTGFRANRRRLPEVSPVFRHGMALTGRPRPRVCLLHTAGGDDPTWVAWGYQALSGLDVVASHLSLFPMPNHEPAPHLLEQDYIWVGGGSVANLLAVWRTHGLDDILRQAWQSGVVLGGVSAGSLCWFLGGTTDSFGPDLRPVTNGLGLLPYGNCPHYDSEEQRRPLFQSLVAAGTVPPGYATDDGVGLHFAGTELVEAVSDRPGASAWQVSRSDAGEAVETEISARILD